MWQHHLLHQSIYPGTLCQTWTLKNLEEICVCTRPSKVCYRKRTHDVRQIFRYHHTYSAQNFANTLSTTTCLKCHIRVDTSTQQTKRWELKFGAGRGGVKTLLRIHFVMFGSSRLARIKSKAGRASSARSTQWHVELIMIGPCRGRGVVFLVISSCMDLPF